MEKLRDSTGIILWVLIFSFGVLWMLQDTNVFSAFGQGPRTLGTVNGETISFDEFQGKVNLFSRNYSQRTGNSTTPGIRAEFQQQAWDQIVTAKLLKQKMDQLGIVVTDQEVVDMIRGDNPAPFIRQQFGREDGSIDRAALQAAINSDENTQIWVAIEQQLRAQRRQQKLNNFIQSAMQVTDYDVKQQYISNNTTADIKYVRFPYSEIPEDEIEVTQNELQSYYKDHQDQFKREESYDFIYVTFSKTPTAADTARTIQEIKDLRQKFAEAKNDSLFLNRYQSVVSYNPVFVDKEDVKPLFKPVLNVKKGEVTNVIKDNGQLYVLKKLDETNDQVKFVTFSFRIEADPVATIDKQSRDAEDFRFYATEQGFKEEAARRDLEIQEASATKGTLFIPGLGQSRLVLSFLESAGNGDISKPIETPSQFIVLKVTDITPEGTRPFKEVKPQIQNIVFNRKRANLAAEKAAGMLKSAHSLQEFANAAGEQVSTMQNLRLSAETIAGAGREPAVIGEVFGLKKGTLSAPIKGTSAVFVVEVTEKKQADASEITSEDAEDIREELQQQKVAAFTQIWIEQLKEGADIKDNRRAVLR